MWNLLGELTSGAITEHPSLLADLIKTILNISQGAVIVIIMI